MTNRPQRQGDGKFHVGGAKFKQLVGSRRMVWNGTAYKTSYGRIKGKGGDALTRKHLKMNKHKRIVSRAKSAKKGKLLKQLRRAGYTTQKGKFGAVKINSTRKQRRTRRRKRRKR